MRWLLTLPMAFALAMPALASAPRQPMVLSIDDGPSLASSPRLRPAERHQLLRDTLARHRITAVMYVTLGFGADRPEGMALARRWAEAGHLLGNHTVSHPDIDDTSRPLQAYLDEILACERAMGTQPGWRRWYRPTFLHEGRDPERRAALQALLRQQGYRIARVQLDSRDWEYAPRYLQQLQAAEGAPLDADGAGDAVKAAFLAQFRERAHALHQQAERDGRPAVLLLHDTLMTALLLDDILRLLETEGFEFVHPELAMAGPADF